MGTTKVESENSNDPSTSPITNLSVLVIPIVRGHCHILTHSPMYGQAIYLRHGPKPHLPKSWSSYLKLQCIEELDSCIKQPDRTRATMSRMFFFFDLARNKLTLESVLEVYYLVECNCQRDVCTLFFNTHH